VPLILKVKATVRKEYLFRMLLFNSSFFPASGVLMGTEPLSWTTIGFTIAMRWVMIEFAVRFSNSHANLASSLTSLAKVLAKLHICTVLQAQSLASSWYETYVLCCT